MLNEIAGAAGQLGVKGKDNIEKFTETFAKLQIASDISGEDGAKSIARILTVTGDGVKNIDRFSSAIVDLGNNSAAGEAEILGVANRVAGATGRFKLGAANVLGISTALKSLGKNAESSGTVIGRTFNQIDQALRNGGRELEQLKAITKLSGEELRTAFAEDSTSVFKKVVDGLARMKGEGKNTVQAMNNLGLKGVRINDVMGTLIDKNEVLTKSLKRSNQAYKDNAALNAEVAEQSKSFNAAMVGFKNTLVRLQVRLGKFLAPAIVFVTKKLKGMMEFFDKNPAIEKFVFVLGGILAVLGPIIAMIGTFVTAAGGFLIVKSMLGALGISVGAILIVFAKFIAIAAVVAFAAVTIYRAWGPIKQFFSDLWNDPMVAIKTFVGFITSIFLGNGIANALIDNWENIGSFFVSIWNAPINAAKGFLKVIDKIINSAQPVKAAFGAISGTFSGIKEAATGAFLTAGDKLSNLFGREPSSAGALKTPPQPEANIGAREVKKQADNREFLTRTNNARVSLDFKNKPENVSVKSSKDSSGFLDINNGLLGAL